MKSLCSLTGLCLVPARQQLSKTFSLSSELSHNAFWEVMISVHVCQGDVYGDGSVLATSQRRILDTSPEVSKVLQKYLSNKELVRRALLRSYLI